MPMYEITKLAPSQIEDQPVITTEMVYTKRVDFTTPASGDLLYKGWAAPGSLDSAAVWRIVRVTINTQGDVTEEWADGDTNFDNVWNDRLTKGYS
jgi:hypothetical protein